MVSGFQKDKIKKFFNEPAHSNQEFGEGRMRSSMRSMPDGHWCNIVRGNSVVLSDCTMWTLRLSPLFSTLLIANHPV